MRECYYMAVVGTMPKADDCKRLHPNGCEGCKFYLKEGEANDMEPAQYADKHKTEGVQKSEMAQGKATSAEQVRTDLMG